MIPRDNKFEGVTTQKNDFKTWPVKPREMRKKQEWVASPHRIDAHSVYQDSFGVKEAEKVHSMAPKHQPLVTGRFEGISTHDADYKSYPGVSRREDFKPRLKYEPKADDRDFLTVMKKDHDLKHMSPCAAIDLIHKPLENKDGHVFIKAAAM